MVTTAREQFNREFTQAKYEQYLRDIDTAHPGQIDFRIAETPLFVNKSFKEKMLSACESIVDVITAPDFKQRTQHAVPAHLNVPGENDHAHFIAFDFGICQNDNGELEPQLIEMQGFPTLFGYQVLQSEALRSNFAIPANYNSYLNGFNREGYIRLLKDIILGQCDPENVILLELFPQQQKTRIDFYCTRDFTGIEIVCLTDLVKQGKTLLYKKNGKLVPVKRIYNRLIFDELEQQSIEVQEKGKILFEELDVTWVPHPNWFYRISKYTLPLISHPYIPQTRYVSEFSSLPPDLENYVLKPLFSFAGQGVVIDVVKADIEKIEDPHNWILQKKVRYADVIPTPDGYAKGEIRIFYFWEDGKARPVATHNLARLSKGKMIGVRYNMDKTWVGGSIAFFED